MSNKFSIIVPVHNGEQTIGRCIDSVISQSFQDWHLIVVLDGCTDRTQAICEEYYRKDNTRISLIIKQMGGVSSARNAGLKVADGEWILFLDSDDALTENALSIFSEASKEDSDLVAGSYFRWSPEFNSKIALPEEKFEHSELEKFSGVLLQNICLGYVWSKMFRASIIRDYHLTFNEAYPIHEDRIFVLDYLSHCRKVQTISSSVYQYTTNTAGSLTKRYVPFHISYASVSDILEKGYKIGSSETYKQNIETEYCNLMFSTLRNMYFPRFRSYETLKSRLRNIHKTLTTIERLGLKSLMKSILAKEKYPYSTLGFEIIGTLKCLKYKLYDI